MPPQKTNSDCDIIKFLFEAYPSKRRDESLDRKEENIDGKLMHQNVILFHLVDIDSPATNHFHFLLHFVPFHEST